MSCVHHLQRQSHGCVPAGMFFAGTSTFLAGWYFACWQFSWSWWLVTECTLFLGSVASAAGSTVCVLPIVRRPRCIADRLINEIEWYKNRLLFLLVTLLKWSLYIYMCVCVCVFVCKHAHILCLTLMRIFYGRLWTVWATIKIIIKWLNFRIFRSMEW